MRQHLDLHFSNDDSNIDKMLAVYPSALSTRVLRYPVIDMTSHHIASPSSMCSRLGSITFVPLGSRL